MALAAIIEALQLSDSQTLAAFAPHSYPSFIRSPAMPEPKPTTATQLATTLPPDLDKQLDILLIDNFDSFSYNLYQSLCLVKPDIAVTVIRNDAIPASLIPLLKIKYLVISPGPGHPHTDSGISRDAIKHFTGKVPILGVCMGLECLVDVFGGDIACVPILYIIL